MRLVTSLAGVRDLLADARTIAILGAHHERQRAAYYVPDYLQAKGYRVLPVNPRLVGQSLWGEPVRASLTELPPLPGDEPIDIVDVFRPADALMAHLPEILAMKPLPRVVWLQLGIAHRGFAEAVMAHGVVVVEDRCTLADHRNLDLPPVVWAPKAPKAGPP